MCRSVCDSSAICSMPELICYTGRRYSEQCCVLNYFAWQSPGIASDIVFLLSAGLIAFILLFVIEFKVLTNLILGSEYNEKNMPPELRHTLDPDVWTEKMQVRALEKSQILKYGLVAKDLCKFYREHFAVKRLCLRVKE